MSDGYAEFLVKLRDALQMVAGAIQEYLKSMAQTETNEKCKQSTAVDEITFAILKFEEQQSAKMGFFEVALKKANLPDEWNYAHNYPQ